MTDWYASGYGQLQRDIAEDTNVPLDTVKIVYGHLVDIGLIDYDIEKEVIGETYGYGDDEE